MSDWRKSTVTKSKYWDIENWTGWVQRGDYDSWKCQSMCSFNAQNYKSWRRIIQIIECDLFPHSLVWYLKSKIPKIRQIAEITFHSLCHHLFFFFSCWLLIKSRVEWVSLDCVTDWWRQISTCYIDSSLDKSMCCIFIIHSSIVRSVGMCICVRDILIAH